MTEKKRGSEGDRSRERNDDAKTNGTCRTCKETERKMRKMNNT